MIVYGHDAVLSKLRSAYERGRLAHAFLFVGPTGIGKRTFAEEFAKGLLCERPPAPLAPCGVCTSCRLFAQGIHPDFFYGQKEDNRVELTVDPVEEFAHHLSTKPARGHRKIGVLDDADVINDVAANKLLKTLEEPPDGAMLILLATGEESQLPTIRSRCQVQRFAPLPDEALRKVLLEQELIEPPRVERVVPFAGGSVEQAMALDSDELAGFRDSLLKGLADARPDVVALSSRWHAFNADVGKDKKLQRPRAIAVIRLVTAFLRDAFAATVGEEPRSEEARRLAARVSTDQLADMLEACVEAESLIDRRAGLEIVIEQLLDRLAVR